MKNQLHKRKSRSIIISALKKDFSDNSFPFWIQFVAFWEFYSSALRMSNANLITRMGMHYLFLREAIFVENLRSGGDLKVILTCTARILGIASILPEGFRPISSHLWFLPLPENLLHCRWQIIQQLDPIVRGGLTNKWYWQSRKHCWCDAPFPHRRLVVCCF